jgi:hypothetical protein
VVGPRLLVRDRSIAFEEPDVACLGRELVGRDPEPLHRVPPRRLENGDARSPGFELMVGTFVDRNLAAEILEDEGCGEAAQ